MAEHGDKGRSGCPTGNAGRRGELGRERDGAPGPNELPFVVGVLGDFSGSPGGPVRPLPERQFTRVDRESFDDVLASLRPAVSLAVADPLGAGEIEARLEFRRMRDFEPAGIARQVEPLRERLQARGSVEDSRGARPQGTADEESGPTGEGGSLLDQVIGATPDGGPADPVAESDRALSRQLAAIMHSPGFRRLEAAWRGLRYLVFETPESERLKIKVLDVSRQELKKDLLGDAEFCETELFRKLDREFHSPEGEPCCVLVGDYEFANLPEDIELLRSISEVAAAAFCPFISSISPAFFGVEDFGELRTLGDLVRRLQTVEYAQWRSYRDSEDSMFVALALPHVLARPPYGTPPAAPVEEFDYRELAGRSESSRDAYCWMNAAHVLGALLAGVFVEHGWFTALGGPEESGRVEGLPNHGMSDRFRCPTDTVIFLPLAAELGKAGFVPLCYPWSSDGVSYVEDADYVVFDGSYRTTCKPKRYRRPEATEDAALSSRLPCVLTLSRVAHQLMVPRARYGPSMSVAEREVWLNEWINGYVCPEQDPSPETKLRYPLAQAKIELREIPDLPGHCEGLISLRPWLAPGELNAPVRFSVHLPP